MLRSIHWRISSRITIPPRFLLSIRRMGNGSVPSLAILYTDETLTCMSVAASSTV